MGKLISLILAAGESERMNSPKMLLPFNGRTIIEQVIENVTASMVSQTIVVLGAYRDAIAEVIKKYPVTYCYNENYKQGMLTSVKCGLKYLPAGYDAVLVFLGDQPMIGAGITNTIIAEYRKDKKGIVIPVCNKMRGHPILISYEYRDEIEKLEDHAGLRLLAQKFPDDILEIEINDSCILRDIDTPKDYENEINQIH